LIWYLVLSFFTLKIKELHVLQFEEQLEKKGKNYNGRF